MTASPPDIACCLLILALPVLPPIIFRIDSRRQVRRNLDQERPGFPVLPPRPSDPADRRP
ncbi:MAG: hypothetical protein JWO31_551 [Phycisphaerales bacterium]|nr:hypothetical protein [Phycisphaerales bacterium]